MRLTPAAASPPKANRPSGAARRRRYAARSMTPKGPEYTAARPGNRNATPAVRRRNSNRGSGIRGRNVSLPRLARGPVGLQEPAGRLIVALLHAVAVVSALLMNSNRAMALPDRSPSRSRGEGARDRRGHPDRGPRSIRNPSIAAGYPGNRSARSIIGSRTRWGWDAGLDHPGGAAAARAGYAGNPKPPQFRGLPR
jgi:hypothetical protein